MTLSIRVAAVVALFPMTALADGVGTITATFDGEERNWHTIAAKRGDDTISTASLNDTDRLSSLSVQAHPEPRFTTSDVISIQVDWFGRAATDKAPVSVEILYLPQGMRNPFYTTDQVADSGATITLESLDTASDPATVSGTFEAKLCLVPKLYEEPDPTDCKAISGRFDTQIVLR